MNTLDQAALGVADMFTRVIVGAAATRRIERRGGGYSPRRWAAGFMNMFDLADPRVADNRRLVIVGTATTRRIERRGGSCDLRSVGGAKQYFDRRAVGPWAHSPRRREAS